VLVGESSASTHFCRLTECTAILDRLEERDRLEGSLEGGESTVVPGRGDGEGITKRGAGSSNRMERSAQGLFFLRSNQRGRRVN